MATSTPSSTEQPLPVDASVWGDVVGQKAAVDLLQALAQRPVHAYLLVGPHGSGKRAMARAFAATLLAQVADDPERAARLALLGRHPDLVEIVPEGTTLRGGQHADTEVSVMLREASMSPIEAGRKVLVVDHLHTANAEAIGRMLKAIEEPTPSVVWVLLSEEVPTHQVTIASRCVRVDLHPVPRRAVADRLVAEGVAPDRAEVAAGASGGDLERGRLLALDDLLVERTAFWAALPDRLDGTGARTMALVDEVLARTGEVLAPLVARQVDEVAALEVVEEEYGPRAGEKRRLVERHKREARLLQTDELVHGLAMIASRYRQALTEADVPASPMELVSAMERISSASQELVVRNANERLLLTALLLDIPPLTVGQPPQRG